MKFISFESATYLDILEYVTKFERFPIFKKTALLHDLCNEYHCQDNVTELFLRTLYEMMTKRVSPSSVYYGSWLQVDKSRRDYNHLLRVKILIRKIKCDHVSSVRLTNIKWICKNI